MKKRRGAKENKKVPGRKELLKRVEENNVPCEGRKKKAGEEGKGQEEGKEEGPGVQPV